MKALALSASIIFCLCFPVSMMSFTWVIRSSLASDPQNGLCSKSRYLTKRQRFICQNEPDTVSQVKTGILLALQECQTQFQSRRWNCSVLNKSMTRLLKYDTRETAFIHGISSAGVMYSLTERCSSGELLQCTCEYRYSDIHTDGQWEWGGCGDDVKYGYRKSKDVFNIRKKHKNNDMRAKVQLHNNEAGRRVITNHMRKICKCHGMSGSCTLKTCWLKMPSFSQVGHMLKQKFDGAFQIISSNDGQSILPAKETIANPMKEDLVYSEKSPSFCQKNNKRGSLGTTGRKCDPKSYGTDGCDLLCCGRGYTQSELTVRENCNCKFMWCCEVVCDICVKKKILVQCR